jgi:hypothetical protein
MWDSLYPLLAIIGMVLLAVGGLRYLFKPRYQSEPPPKQSKRKSKQKNQKPLRTMKRRGVKSWK